MTNDVVRLDQLGRSDVALAGGKAANLGELSRIDGVRVPPGFCVTTDAFRRFMSAASVDDLLDRLSHARPDGRDETIALSTAIRSTIEQTEVPADVVATILDAVVDTGEHSAWAVRSSATAEDLPTASFAGQHDTYLNVVGTDRDHRRDPPLLGVVVHRTCGRLSPTERHRASQRRHRRDRAADGRAHRVRCHVHRRPRHVRPHGRRHRSMRRTRRGAGLGAGDSRRVPGAQRNDRRHGRRDAEVDRLP